MIYTHNAVTGGLLIVAAAMLLARVMLLEPDSPQFPKAPTWVRNTMLIFVAVMLFTGINVAVNSLPVPAASSLFAACLVIYKGVMLANIARQRYPEQVWNRLERINSYLHCKTPTSRWFSE